MTSNQTAKNYTAAAVVAAPPTPGSITYPTSSIMGYAVSWATSYHLERSADGGTTWTQISTGAATSHAETIGNGSYRYRVRASNAGGNSTWRTGPAVQKKND